MHSRRIISSNEADKLREAILNENQERWVKTKRDIGNYSCLFKHTMSKELYNKLCLVAPEKQTLVLEEIVVNRYNTGEYIKNHVDNTIYLSCEILQLTENRNEGLHFVENGDRYFIQDKKGFCNSLEPLDTEHEVLAVNEQRIVVIYLYN